MSFANFIIIITMIRKKLIDFILIYSGDEIKTLKDWYKLSISSIEELKQIKKNIQSYYKNELNEFIKL